MSCTSFFVLLEANRRCDGARTRAAFMAYQILGPRPAAGLRPTPSLSLVLERQIRGYCTLPIRAKPYPPSQSQVAPDQFRSPRAFKISRLLSCQDIRLPHEPRCLHCLLYTYFCYAHPPHHTAQCRFEQSRCWGNSARIILWHEHITTMFA